MGLSDILPDEFISFSLETSHLGIAGLSQFHMMWFCACRSYFLNMTICLKF